MKMKTVLLPAGRYLEDRMGALLKRGYSARSNTQFGSCEVVCDTTGQVLCSTEFPGGRQAKPNSHGPIILTLPAYLVRDTVPECDPTTV